MKSTIIILMMSIMWWRNHILLMLLSMEILLITAMIMMINSHNQNSSFLLMLFLPLSVTLASMGMSMLILSSRVNNKASTHFMMMYANNFNKIDNPNHK
uniref:NADH dehydrogenase subunit 4L n=2 Tax=unclassified Mesabolivar TaxID=2625251 RepID=A0A411FET1_9ARAC|nr:NADH dehydrogenase subunit 4L [Mesabolivar sp. ITV1036I1]YP_009554256.1 NADH dehydrogenase subunit 4L [Mesabolivar sp. ITV1036I3]QBA91986.1 NADH dehydrogenase subunit 4L [Mesabolivar sp. ITV1036I1]QBA92012.1 NADH dehydrogenase subunit 4L [Mesabolivar sp. ITV1036I3]